MTIHPETVAKAESLAKKSSKRLPKVEPEVTRRYLKKPDFLNAMAWEEGLRRADGNPRRIVVESSTCVLVVNN